MALFSPTTVWSLLACTLGAALHAAASGNEQARPVIPGFERFYPAETDDASLAEGGLLLLQEMNCIACHAAPEAWREHLATRNPLSLATVGDRLQSAELRAFISNPQAHKPGTLMPKVFQGSDADLEALVAYLRSRQSRDKKMFPQGSVGDGRTLFHTIGCVACHAPASAESYHPAEVAQGMPVEKPKLLSVPIRLAHDYQPGALAAFLQTPLQVRHAGRMPDFQLTDQQAADIAAYLQEGLPPRQMIKDAASGPAIDLGGKVFASQNCAACHDVGHEVALKPVKALADLRQGSGCLSASFENDSAAPHYPLSAHQRHALELALSLIKAGPPQALDAARKSDRFLTQMNCYACHEWQGKGGLEKARSQYFTVYEPSAHSLGEIGMLPPRLDHAGRKLTRAWMEKLLWGKGGGVRPYMTARMPKFGKDNAQSFIAPFAEACQSHTPVSMDTSGLPRHQRSAYGRTLIGAGEGSLGCISCHGLKDRKSLGVPVVNLTHTVERLQPSYFKELLLNPQAVQPGTLMPPLFMGRKKADIEIEQLWTYLKEIDQSPLPEGLLTSGDYELKPREAKRAMVFRTFLEGAGTQAIAVGFPSEHNLAFDAHEVRWALAWKGPFLDAMTTWEERAMTPAKPLGKHPLTLPMHMPLARLGSAGDPWPDSYGEHAGYAFHGYRLRPDGVPVFSYAIGGLQVEDVIETRGRHLHRQLTIHGKGEGWFFLGLTQGQKPQPLVWKNGTAILEEQLPW